MSRLDLVMIVRDEARCLERCLASARPWVDGWSSSTPARSMPRPRSRAATARAWRASPGSTTSPPRAMPPWPRSDADLAAGAGCRRVDRRGRQSLAALRAQAPDFVGQVRVASSFDAPAAAWTRRRAGCRASCRAASRYQAHPRAAAERVPRRRLPLSSATTATSTRRRPPRPVATNACSAWPLAEPHDAYLTTSSARTWSCGGRFAEAEPHYRARSSAATRRPAGATTWCCAPCSR